MYKLLSFLFLFIGINSFAQTQKTVTVEIQTSAKCDECKERIEKALAYEKGVKQAQVNLKNAIVTITYNADKTNPQILRKTISLVGYDADSVKADTKAYQSLPTCCQKGH